MPIGEKPLKLILENVANNLNIKQWSFNETQINKTHENYFGNLRFVTLSGIQNEREVEKPIFIKFAPSDVTEQIKEAVIHMYKTEAYFYTQLIPIYKQITKVDIDGFIPECYYASVEPNNQVIVLKDMRSDGFQRYAEKKSLDREHITLSLKTIAKFHSLSIIYKEKGGDFDHYSMRPFDEKHVEIYYLQIKKALENKMYIFIGTPYENYMKGLLSNVANYIISAGTEVSYLVYGHCDLTTENFLFKYKNSKPIQACLFDYQASRKTSPAQDLLQLLLLNFEVSDKWQHSKYLNIYLDTLHRILNENGLDETYSYDNLNRDMKIVSPHCVLAAVMGYSLWLGVEFDNILTNCTTDRTFQDNITLYKNIIIKILDGLQSYGYIQI